MQHCSLCDPTLGPVLSESRHWRLVLNHNQNLLGKCFLVLRRHLEAVPQLTVDEWLEVYQQLGQTTALLTAAFAPDHFNYAFLQNQDRHIHLHIIPRYAAVRHFAGLVFEDLDYPGHYAVPAPAQRLEPEHQRTLANLLQQHLEKLHTQDQAMRRVT
jgi:diadenosine tetraphosphate (Ap4A) HIT family hydrolase